jgi:hypothetical protein
MPRLTVQHSYASSRDGRKFGPWAAGETVDLDPDDVAWVERDSPGVFAIDDPPPAREKPSTPNRQARPAANRSK